MGMPEPCGMSSPALVSTILWKPLFTIPCIEDSKLPAILGGETLTRMRCLIDCHNDEVHFVGEGGFCVDLSPGTFKLDLERKPFETRNNRGTIRYSNACVRVAATH